jgi:hypothetical protein
VPRSVNSVRHALLAEALSTQWKRAREGRYFMAEPAATMPDGFPYCQGKKLVALIRQPLDPTKLRGLCATEPISKLPTRRFGIETERRTQKLLNIKPVTAPHDF